MNTLEMHTKVREQLLEDNTPEYDLLTDSMIDNALTSVAIEFTDGVLEARDGKAPDQDLHKYASIYTLIKTLDFSIASGTQPMEDFEISVPEAMLQPIPSSATTQRIVAGTDNAINPLLQQKAEIVFQAHADIFNIIDNPFSTSSLKRINATLEPNFITLHLEKKSIVIDVSLKYICIPNKISLLLYKEDSTKGLCDLPEGVHNKIVESAVRYLLEEFQSQRHQTN